MIINQFNNDGKECKIKIKDVKLRKDMQGYSLDLTYTVETLTEISEMHIPRLMLPIHGKPICITLDNEYYGSTLCTADIGFGECRLLSDDNNSYYTLKPMKTKTKEMTLDEIEKKLGHKVKIVNK